MNPINSFFKLGDKVSNGDPVKKARFDYYLLWIMFLAFCTVAYGNFHKFFKTNELQYVGWGLVILCILWFQYFALRGARQGVIMLESIKVKKVDKKEEIESVSEMLEGFK